MEVYCLDVGQATCSVVLLGEGRAIIVDCGRSPRVLLQLLNRFHVHNIVRLIISHNHDDHIGGALAVMTAFENQIDKICLLDDGALFESKLRRKIYESIKMKRTLSNDQIVRLECADRPRMLYEELTNYVDLKVFSPQAAENLFAAEDRTPNAASAVLVLTIQGRKIVFAGDSTIDQWKEIRNHRDGPLECDLLSAPHHGGLCGDPNDLTWLYREGLKTRYAIISVATSNQYGHPREDVVRAMTSSGAIVICTQMTRLCHSDLESIRPGVLRQFGSCASRASTDRTAGGSSRNVACAGTIEAEVVDGTFKIRRLDEHQLGVNRLLHVLGGDPLCRRT